MKCPHCDHTETTLLEALGDDDGIRRRYDCPACRRSFATEEVVRGTNMMVVKRDARRERFQRAKLQHSLRVAASKRPLATGALDAIVEDIEQRLAASGRAEVASRVIGEMAITQLKRLDPIAYIRYASLYRQFVSLDDMIDELQQMVSSPIPPPEQRRLFEDDMDRAVHGEGELPRTPTPIGSLRSSMAF